MAGGKFDHPARKLHAQDVLSLENRGGAWRYSKAGLNFTVSLVWVQGKVISFTEDKKQVILQDGNTNISITNCHTIPGGNAWISQGQYVMVVGEMQEELDGTNAIRAIKMADLSSSSVHAATWRNEVAETKALMRENVSLCS
ncbi:recQ-mediated genome instability protein 2 [Penaeus vannamei]|uniref:recQ-mediated genome instability protein 2 n=1 Tax=Penaeus vannamei TaxID=6689 RepID=UPI000F661BC8|nr:recQ-mediated genome instability protein 2-like [Penaeus vannamei]